MRHKRRRVGWIRLLSRDWVYFGFAAFCCISDVYMVVGFAYGIVIDSVF